jgi:hypothetical protein
LVKRKDKDTTPSVWNPHWKYQTAGSALDLAEKFKRIRKQQELEAKEKKMRRVK